VRVNEPLFLSSRPLGLSQPVAEPVYRQRLQADTFTRQAKGPKIPVKAPIRFGEQMIYSATDIQTLNPDLLREFRSMFKPGTKMVSAPSMEHPVLLREVVANDGKKIELKNPYDPQKTDVIPLKEETLQVYAHQILLNLPLINGEVSRPEELWVQTFRQIVDQVSEENEKIGRSPLPYPNVDNKKKIYQPCGFNLEGHLFMLRNPDFDNVGEPVNDRLKGDPDGVKDMFLSLQAENRRQYYEKPENTNEVWQKLGELILVVPPRTLRPIYCEGMYEKAGFVFIPS
jgi:hypothetical protein